MTFIQLMVSHSASTAITIVCNQKRTLYSRQMQFNHLSLISLNEIENKNTNLPPTSSTPSSNMSLVKFDICPVKEDRLPPTCPRDWPRPEPSPPSHDDMFRRATNQTTTKQGQRELGGASLALTPEIINSMWSLSSALDSNSNYTLEPPFTSKSTLSFRTKVASQVDTLI